MDEFWGYIRDYLWLWVLFAVGSAVWIASVVVVYRSPKFLRKWLWLLLSLFAFSWSWSISDDTTVGVGLPIGSLYILWFWRFGRPPTPDEIAGRKGRKGSNINSPLLVMFLRAIYLVGALAFAMIGYLAASGAGLDLTPAIHQSNAFSRMVLFPREAMAIGLSALDAAFILLMLFLSFRPYWWGKIICLWAGVSWIGFAAMAYAFPQPFAQDAAFICGTFMLAAATAHQIIDPRFNGSYLRVQTAQA